MAELFHQLIVEPRRPRRIRESARAPWFAVAAVCVGAFMGQLDASIVTLALPNLRHDLRVGLGVVQWVSLSYLLVLIASVSAAGRLADVFGRKLVYNYGFVVFTLASLGCALAHSLAVLLVARVVQAVGAAMLQANSVALIRTTVAPGQLRRAIGLQAAAQAVGLGLGPVVGGLLLQWAGWRWIFLVNVPAGALGFALGWLLLPRTRIRAERQRLDVGGLVLLALGSSALLLGLSSLSGDSGRSRAVGLLVLAVGLSAAFVRFERRQTAPLIDVAVFQERLLRSRVLAGVLAYLVLFAALLIVPLYLEAQYHSAPVGVGLILASLPVALGLASALAGHGSITASAAATGGALLLALAMLGLGAVAILAGSGGRLGDWTLAGLIVALAVAGAGLGLFTPANNAALAAAGAAENAGMMAGVVNLSRGIGTACGVAVAGTGYAIVTERGSSSGTPAQGLIVVALVLATLAGLAARLSRSGRDGADPH